MISRSDSYNTVQMEKFFAILNPDIEGQQNFI